MNEIFRSYIEDLRDSLVLFNEALMLLDKGITDGETLNKIFRVAHTIKGNSAAMEFMKVEKVMHTMEDILHEIREGEREFTPQIISVQYKCHDFLEDFMETLLEVGSDENVQIESLLKELITIKDGKAPEVQAPVEIIVEPDSADNVLDNISIELLEVIQKNIEMSMFAYQILIKFKEDVPMKSVRAFLLFQKIETNATLVYSDPEKPSEEDFRNGDFDFDGNELNIVILSKNDMLYLIEELKEDYNVADVEFSNLTAEQIRSKLARVKSTVEIVEVINKIEVNILDVQKRAINKDIVKDVLQKLNKINKIDCIQSSLFKNIADKLINILKVTSKKNKTFTTDHAQAFALILRDMTDIAKQNSTLIDDSIIKRIEENIVLLEEELLEHTEKIGNILQRKGILNNSDVQDIVKKQNEGSGKLKFGQVAVKEKKVSAVAMTEALKEQQNTATKRTSGHIETVSQIRVPVSKLDNLMDMLGELIILNSQLEQQIEASEHVENGVLNLISRAAKIIHNVQDLSMSLRLIQIKNTLLRLTRVIRDTASELNKNVTISIKGEETEIDRSAAEKLFDPLMHLVRNAVSHGIETPEERKNAGKSVEGKVEIKAYSRRGHVYIEVNDDGKGIDTDVVLKKAIKVGLADESAEYTEDEIVNFIMKPGFSTQVKVNNISGRGVGMNVVESELVKIGGKVDIFNDKGNGCSFVLRIPMNLALINGTIVQIGDSKYIMPTLFIQQFLIQEESEWLSMQGEKRAIKVRDRIIPLITDEQIFGIKSANQAERKQIVILEMEHKLIALPVDKIVGRQEIVSKPLSNELASAGVISGASILGDGKVSLILDVEALFKIAGQ